MQYRLLGLEYNVSNMVGNAIERWKGARLAEANVIALAGRPAAADYLQQVMAQYDKLAQLITNPFMAGNSASAATDEDSRKYLHLMDGKFMGFGEAIEAMKTVNRKVIEAKENADPR